MMETNFLEEANNILYMMIDIKNPIKLFILKRKLLKSLNKWNEMTLLSISDVKTFIRIFNNRYISAYYIAVNDNNISIFDKRCVFGYTRMTLFVSSNDRLNIECARNGNVEDCFSYSIYDKEFSEMKHKVIFHAFCKAIKECMTEYINTTLRNKREN